MTRALTDGRNLSHSILDFGVIAPGRAGADVLAESLALAARADELGYCGLWLSEHHEAHYCWAGPEVMAAALAQRTRRLCIGTAALLLPLRNPLAVAETFRSLEALTPGRIALGVCASVPLDRVALTALAESASVLPESLTVNFAIKLDSLIAHLHGDFPPDHRFGSGATPCFATLPPVWVMGSGGHSAAIAAARKTNYAHSLFHRNSRMAPEITSSYRTAHPRGRVALAATCICGETESAVAEQRQLVEHWLGGDLRIVISGTPERCRDQILELADRFQADEVILLHAWHVPGPRIAAIEALAELLGLRKEGMT
jgi:luciferase family oxidoreductase group 1